jgi:hypothetical protein
MFRICSVIASEFSSRVGATLSKAVVRGSSSPSRINILQKSFFGVGLCVTRVKKWTVRLELTKHLQFKDASYTDKGVSDEVGLFLVIFV